MRSTSEFRLAVIGLGYVGLPLAVEFAKTRPVLGFDINEQPHRRSCARGDDVTRELSSRRARPGRNFCDFRPSRATSPSATSSSSPCRRRSTTTSSPTSAPILSASATIGKRAEEAATSSSTNSTVYPGATEEDCVPVLEKVSGPEVQRRLLRRLQPGAHQSRRQGAPRRHDQEDHLRLDAGGRRPGRRALQ